MKKKDDNIYKKENGKFIPIGKLDWHDFSFPSDGIWMVKYYPGGNSASCVRRLHDLPNPYPFYNMMLDRDKICSHLLKTTEGCSMSLQEITDSLICYLSQLNKKEGTLNFHKPHKPLFKLQPTNRYNGNFKCLEIKKIFKRKNVGSNFFEISFVDYDKKLCTSELTSFVDNKNRARMIDQLKSGDKIWVDVHAYTKDRSLH